MQAKLPPAKAGESAPRDGTAGRSFSRTTLESTGVAAEASPDPTTEAHAPGQASVADGDGDWVGSAADDEVDDEGTLEEEEVRPSPSGCSYLPRLPVTSG